MAVRVVAQSAMRSWGFLEDKRLGAQRSSGAAAPRPPQANSCQPTPAAPSVGLDSMAPAMIYSRLIRYGKSVSPLIMHWTRC